MAGGCRQENDKRLYLVPGWTVNGFGGSRLRQTKSEIGRAEAIVDDEWSCAWIGNVQRRKYADAYSGRSKINGSKRLITKLVNESNARTEPRRAWLASWHRPAQ